MKTIYIVVLAFLMSEPTFAQKVITLEKAKEMALEKNNQLRIAQQNTEAAKATKIGNNAALYPHVSVSTTGFYFGKPISDLVPGYGAAATLGINQSIYNGGKIKLGIDAAQKQVEIQEAQKAVSKSEVLINVERSYWQIVNLYKKMHLLENSKALLQALLNDLDNGVKAGTVYKNDALRAQVAMNNADLNIIKLKDQLTIAHLSLAQIIGIPNENFTVSDTLVGEFGVLEQLDTSDADKRPEIDLYKKIIEQQRIQVNAMRSDYKPSVSLNINGVTSVGKKGINFGDPNSNTLTSYYGLLSISIPIFDGGANRQKIKAQTYSISAQEIQLEEARQLISIEVEKSYLQLHESFKKIELSKISVAQAEENLRLTNDRFKAGNILSKDVIEAQNLWEQANSDLIDAKVQFRISEAELKKAIGTLN